MDWYWLVVIFHEELNEQTLRFQANDDYDAVRRAQNWCLSVHGGYHSLAVAKECFVSPNKFETDNAA